jgi:NADPH:quinone reductase-like Zn-dependent oxidoreductase
MKAVLCTEYGLDHVHLEEIEKPTPKENGVLIKVHAAAVNPMEWHSVRGPLMARLGGGLRRPKNPRIGADLAGQVEAVGSAVTQFKPGDEVYGVCTGAFAEYVSANHLKIAPKPTNLSFEQAAAVPIVAFTALQGLRDRGKIKAGQKVLINGAAGGIGTFAVQLAKYFGAEVTGVCSTRNLDMVRSIGADHVIDYTREDFSRNGQKYDLIYDAIGNRSVFTYRRALNPQGICVIAGFTSMPRLFEHLFLAKLVSKLGDRQVRFMGISKANQEDLLFMKELLEAGKVVPVIDRCYSLNEVPEAIGYIGQKHARGKVIISLIPSN